MSIIKVNNLGKRYKLGEEHSDLLSEKIGNKLRGLFQKKDNHKASEDFWALKDIFFEVQPGEVVGIIGKNGAGKSTLLKILSRITPPTTGEVEMLGRVASLLEVGTGFHPELTGRENVFLNGAILGMSRAEIRKKFDEIVAFAENEEFIDTPVKRYSSGMYVRLAFAVAAHLDPEILIIDEVLAVGDAEFQKRCLGKIGDISKAGRTVLFVSHNMGAVNTLCNSAILLDKGSITMEGESTIVTQEYISKNFDRKVNSRGYRINSDVINKQNFNGFKIIKIELFNPNNHDMFFMTGDPLLIRISYRSLKKFVSPAFIVQFKDMYGQEIVRLSTKPISGYEIERLFDNGHIDLHIDSLPLVGGRFFIDIGFAREGMEWLLKLENVVELNVQAKDVYGSGTLLDRSRGLIVVNHRWEHNNICVSY